MYRRYLVAVSAVFNASNRLRVLKLLKGFYAPSDAHLGVNYIRFGACKSDAGLDLAVERLRKLKPYLAAKNSRESKL